MVLRFYDLPLKPLHHDEGVNTLLLTNLVRPPHDYRYDPANYHGPTLYYLTWPAVRALGLTTVAVRFVTALVGLLAVLLLLALHRQIGTAGALAAAALLALSPGAVFFSRYFIHEMLLVGFTIATVVAAVRFADRRHGAFVVGAAASAGLMFATKETAAIAGVVLAAAWWGAAALCALRDTQCRGAAPRRDQIRPRLLGAATACVPTWLSPRRAAWLLALATAAFLAVNLLFYTSLFTHWPGALDAVKAFTIWSKTGTVTHTRPWHAYLYWLAVEELPLLVAGTAGVAWALRRLDNRFAVFAALWTLGMLAAYSVIPYKTPWLTLNIVAPLAVCGGYAFKRLWQSRRRAVSVAAAVAIAGTAGTQAVLLNFVRYDDPRHPYVYVHTSREIFALLREIGRIETMNPGATIAVTSRDQFPLSWYLRDYRAGYYGHAVVTNDALVVASEEQQATLEASFGDRYSRVGSYRLRPGVQLVLYVRRDLRRPPSNDAEAGG